MSTPEPWASAMILCGYVHREAPSVASLARAAGLATETVRRMVNGKGEADPGNVLKVKQALRGAPVETWLGMKPVGEVYVGPPVSRLMDDRQRDALTELINAMMERGGSSASTGEPGKKSPDDGGGEVVDFPAVDAESHEPLAARRNVQTGKDRRGDEGEG